MPVSIFKKHYNLGLFKEKSAAIRVRGGAEAKLHNTGTV